MSQLRLAATIVVAITLSACTTVEKTVVADPRVLIVAEPNGVLSLPLGQTATVAGSQYRVTFRQVTEDSRCPINAVCVWEGRARIEIAVSTEGGPTQTAILSLTPPDKNEVRIGDLLVKLVGLAPAPETPQPPRNYVAELVITKL